MQRGGLEGERVDLVLSCVCELSMITRLSIYIYIHTYIYLYICCIERDVDIDIEIEICRYRCRALKGLCGVSFRLSFRCMGCCFRNYTTLAWSSVAVSSQVV